MDEYEKTGADYAVDTLSSLRKQIEILKGMIVESQMAKLCWCDKCCDKGRSAKKEREKLFRELDALIVVKELQNVKSTKKE